MCGLRKPGLHDPQNDEFLVEKAIRMQRNDPRTLLAVEVGHYSDAVLERLTSQGYTVEVIDTYSMWEPDVPVLPDVEVPKSRITRTGMSI